MKVTNIDLNNILEVVLMPGKIKDHRAVKVIIEIKDNNGKIIEERNIISPTQNLVEVLITTIASFQNKIPMIGYKLSNIHKKERVNYTILKREEKKINITINIRPA